MIIVCSFVFLKLNFLISFNSLCKFPGGLVLRFWCSHLIVFVKEIFLWLYLNYISSNIEVSKSEATLK